MKLTKIVATLGPASDSPEMIKDLIESGVNVFRFNTKHGTPEWHEERIKRVQEVADSLSQSVGILLDLQGPEIRIETKNKEDIALTKGEPINLSYAFLDDDVSVIVPEKDVLAKLEIGDKFFIDDGKVILKVSSKENERIGIVSEKDTVIKHRKGVNMPDKTLDLPSLVEADLRQLDMASLNKVDFIALSFVRDIKDVDALKKEIEERNINAKIVLKIENRDALKNLDSLIEAGDAIMVARGDMGIEVAIEEIAFWQKVIIDKCRNAHKPVITATEMLDSMMRQERPTRAEATDVSNAVFDGTDAVMLSGETASGEYPVESVQMMSKIADFTEAKVDIVPLEKEALDMTQLICVAAMEMIINEGIDVDKIVVFSHTGYTARIMSSFRPNVPILAVTDSQKTVETLELSYAVKGHVFEFNDDDIVSPRHMVDELIKRGQVESGEMILVMHGERWKTPGLTNSITLVDA